VTFRKTPAVVASFILIAASLLAGEGTIRIGKAIAPQLAIFMRLKNYDDYDALAGRYFAPSTFNPLTLAANFSGYEESGHQPGKMVLVTTNSLGLRGPEITLAKPSKVKRILVLGDSYTFGLYLRDHETYSVVLETALRQQGFDVQVINAGYADGFCPDEHYAWLRNVGITFKPDIVVYGFFVNDLDCANKKYWAKKDEHGLPIRIINPHLRVENGAIIEDPEAEGNDVRWYLRVPGLRHSYVFVTFARLFDRIVWHFIPGWAPGYWERDPLPWLFREKSTAGMRDLENLFFEITDGMKKVSNSAGAQFVVAMIPMNIQVHEDLLAMMVPQASSLKLSVKRNFFEEAAPRLRNLGIDSIDLLAELKGQNGRFYPENGEVHFNAAGARAAGLAIAKKLKPYLETEARSR